MTPFELRAVLAKLGLSTRQAARRCGITDRFMRRCVAGQDVLPDAVAQRLMEETNNGPKNLPARRAPHRGCHADRTQRDADASGR